MKRLLIAHSDPVFAHGAQVALEKRGIAVETVCDGFLALHRLQLGLVDVCVMDPQLPTIDGLALVRRLRQQGVHTPILILAEPQTQSSRITWFDAGADDFLGKPFDLEEFIARIRSLHRRHGQETVTKIRCGPLIFDLLSGSFFLGDSIAAFTPREYAFVKALISRPGYPVPRDRIIRAVFPDSTSLGAIDVVACRVRRKLHGSGVRLNTVRGLGYSLVEERVCTGLTA